jgi:hypothetical protein
MKAFLDQDLAAGQQWFKPKDLNKDNNTMYLRDDKAMASYDSASHSFEVFTWDYFNAVQPEKKPDGTPKQ